MKVNCKKCEQACIEGDQTIVTCTEDGFTPHCSKKCARKYVRENIDEFIYYKEE